MGRAWGINTSYTVYLGWRYRRSGHLYHGRYKALLIDADSYLLPLGRYVHLNPVRAKLVPSPAAWPWSSARAHLSGRDDCLVKVAPLLAMIAEWRAFLNSAVPEEELRDLRRHGRTGRPLGDEAFLGRLEERVGRALKPQKRGPKPKQQAN